MRPEALLGYGGESRVYALDDDRVLRVYERGAGREYVDQLRAFYDRLSTPEVPFQTPAVLDVAEHQGATFAIERRIPGDRMSNYLLTATGAARERSLDSYVATASLIQDIPIDASAFGELLPPEPLRRPSWTEYLHTRAHGALARCEEEFARDVPGLADLVAAWDEELAQVSDVTEPKLVHGDYFPGNVMVDGEGIVTAVIDFSPMTVAGDPRLDVLCALFFIELDDGYQPDDSEIVRRMIAERHGEAILQLERVYRTYYSLYFSPVKQGDPSLYAWCVGNLRSAPYDP